MSRKAIGYPSCDITLPNCVLLESVCITNGLLKLGKAKSVSLAITLFISLNELSSISVHVQGLELDVSAVRWARLSDLFGHMSL